MHLHDIPILMEDFCHDRIFTKVQGSLIVTSQAQVGSSRTAPRSHGMALTHPSLIPGPIIFLIVKALIHTFSHLFKSS